MKHTAEKGNVEDKKRLFVNRRSAEQGLMKHTAEKRNVEGKRKLARRLLLRKKLLYPILACRLRLRTSQQHVCRNTRTIM
jgi:hypothetical protein